MRLSWTQAATGALTGAVVAGLLILPGRLLGSDSSGHNVVALATTAPRPVQAAPVAERASRQAPEAHVAATQRLTATPVRVHLPAAKHAVAVKIAHYTLGAAFTAKPKAKAKRIVVAVPTAATTPSVTVADAISVPLPKP